MSQSEYLVFVFFYCYGLASEKDEQCFRGLSVCLPLLWTQAGLDLSPGGSDRRCGEAAGFPAEGEGFPGSGPEC